MTNIIRKCFPFIVFVITLLSFFWHPALVFAEEIRNFSERVEIQKDGHIKVSEQIDYDFEDLERHGIFRTIPTIKTNTEGKKFKLTFEDISVKDERGANYTYTTSEENNVLTIKIGDANKTITGRKTYVLSYTVGGAVTYFSDHDELYWNVTGTRWPVPIDQASAEITLPDEVKPNTTKMACYTGSAGSVASGCTIRNDNGVLKAEVSEGLGSYEGLTVVYGFPKGMVAVLEPREIIDFWTTPLGKIIAVMIGIIIAIVITIWYLGLPLYLVYKWWKVGRDPKVSIGVATAWFSPPKNKAKEDLTPGEVGALVDEQVDMRDVSATIVDLARRGFITIKEEKKEEFTLEKQDVSQASLHPFEKTFLHGIFGSKQSIKLKDGNIVSDVEKLKTNLYERIVEDGFFEKNPQTIRTRYAILGTFAFITGNILLAIVAFTFGLSMPRKTVLGAEAANIAASLKKFLTSQEKFLKYQADKQLMFEKLLPYAVAFGVETIWAKRFKDIALTAPTWYQGYESSRFNSMIFVHSLSNSFHSVSSAATPVRSSSGFSSGFSGGGSSGGGGGGGGGGSW